MIFADELYVDPELSKSYRKVLRQVKENKIPLTWYLIARPQSGLFPYNIYPAYLLKEKYYQELDDVVMGIAASKDEALKLAGMMAVKDLK